MRKASRATREQTQVVAAPELSATEAERLALNREIAAISEARSKGEFTGGVECVDSVLVQATPYLLGRDRSRYRLSSEVTSLRVSVSNPQGSPP